MPFFFSQEKTDEAAETLLLRIFHSRDKVQSIPSDQTSDSPSRFDLRHYPLSDNDVALFRATSLSSLFSPQCSSSGRHLTWPLLPPACHAFRFHGLLANISCSLILTRHLRKLRHTRHHRRRIDTTPGWSMKTFAFDTEDEFMLCSVDLD